MISLSFRDPINCHVCGKAANHTIVLLRNNTDKPIDYKEAEADVKHYCDKHQPRRENKHLLRYRRRGERMKGKK